MLIDILFFLFAAVLTGLGIGSGGFLIVYLTALKGIPQLEAQALNLIFFILCASVSTIINIRSKRIIAPFFFMMSFFGVIGAVLGSIIAANISGSILKHLFGFFLILLGTYELTRKSV